MAGDQDPFGVIAYELIRVRDVSSALNYLSDAFHVTGNVKLGRNLAEMAEDLRKSSDVIGKANGQIVADRLRDAQESTANLMTGILAGMDMAEKDDPVS